MGTFWLVACLAVAGLAALHMVLIGVQIHEHRRYARSRLDVLRFHGQKGRAALFVPCKGVDADLEANLHALFRQDYGNYEIVFIVEGADDPAYGLIRRVASAHPDVDWGIILAGRARGSGQKVHNLLAATRRISPDVELLAFVDSDAQPATFWLRALVAHLGWKGVGAATGYRWFVPESPNPASLLLYSMNCYFASLIGKHTPNYVWGGSWAIRREKFEELGIREAWKGTLSDDYMVTRVMRRAGLHVEFEPAAMVASPLERQSLGRMLSFARRQFVITKFYTSRGWLSIMAMTVLDSLGLFGSLGAMVYGLAHGGPWWPVAAGLFAVMYLTHVFRGLVRMDLSRFYFPHLERPMRAARRFDLWAAPLADLTSALALVSSIVGRHITWRGVTYRILRGGQIRLVRRADAPAPTAPQPGTTPPAPHIATQPAASYKRAG
jgi:cellulose synthase/poly-beta-1,6-N-acetylglucosamine synthase-like glycosyltransferase